MKFSEVLNALNSASSFELFRLRAAITAVLDDPARVQAIQSRMTRGQTVEFFDSRANAKCKASVLELRRKTALVVAHADQQKWLMEYAAFDLDGVDVQIQPTTNQGLSRNQIAVGDTLGYLSAQGRQCSGKVIRLNDKTVTLQVEDQEWRIPYRFLHRVVEADVVDVGPIFEAQPAQIAPY
jgi:hypothetical protein